MTSLEELTIDGAEPEAWVGGSVVLSVGTDADGIDSLAVWQVGSAGRPTGAWIEPCGGAFADRSIARRLLALVESCALIAESADVVDEVVGKLTAAAGIDMKPNWWVAQVATPADAFADVLRRRAEVEATVIDARESRRSVAAVAWSRDLASELRPTSVQELRAVARLSKPAGAPVVSEAVGVVRVLEWLVTAWKETEQVKNRRAYVENALGPVEPLPPCWRTAIAAANENRLPL